LHIANGKSWLLFCSILPVSLGPCSQATCAATPDERPGVEAQFIHPGIAHNRAELDFVREQVNANRRPWSDAWEELRKSKYADLKWRPGPSPHVERGAYNRPDIGASEFMRGGTASYTHALAWYMTQDVRHAKKSREIINGWSETLETITNHDARLLVGMTGHQFCNAAEILRHTWDGWPESEQQRFRDMLRSVWYPIIKDFYPSANGNWDAAMIQTMYANQRSELAPSPK